MLTEEHFELFKDFRIKAMGDKLREMVEDESYDAFTSEEKMEMLLNERIKGTRDEGCSTLSFGEGLRHHR